MLVNGELRTWHGHCQTVLSPIRVRNDAGDLEPVELGSYPEGPEHDSEEALAAALPIGGEERSSRTLFSKIFRLPEFGTAALKKALGFRHAITTDGPAITRVVETRKAK